jgi:hypothetical protein
VAAVTQVRILVTAVTTFFLPRHIGTLNLEEADGIVAVQVMKKRQWYSGEHSCLPSS